MGWIMVFSLNKTWEKSKTNSLMVKKCNQKLRFLVMVFISNLKVWAHQLIKILVYIHQRVDFLIGTNINGYCIFLFF
jgi:hypothetical protein